MSRPSALTDDVHRGILAAIRAGNDNVVAARAQGIDESTFYRWLERGADDAPCTKRFTPSAAHIEGKVDWKACPTEHTLGECPGNELYRDFRHSVERAQGEFEVLMSASIAKAAPTNPRMALALLDRRVPERWKLNRPVAPATATTLPSPPFTIQLIEYNRPESEVREIMGERYVPRVWADDAGRGGASDARPACDECRERLIWTAGPTGGDGHWVCKSGDRHADGQPHSFTVQKSVVRQNAPT